MKRLRNILQCSFIYYLLLIISLIYFFIYNGNTYVSKYEEFSNEKFKIIKIDKTDYGYKILFKGKEKVLGYYNGEFKYDLGDFVLVSGDIKEIDNNTVDNIFDYKEYLYNKKIYNVISVNKISLISKNKNIFYKMKNILVNRTNKLKHSYSYANSLILGDNSDILENVKDSYKNNGISHLFAISGLHISLFIFIISKVLKYLNIKGICLDFILIFFLIFYMFLTNYSMSVVRCSLLNILIIIKRMLKVDVKNIYLLLFELVILIFINPLCLFDIGFLFSYLITLFLFLYSDLLNEYKGIKKIFIISLMAFLVSYPICVNNFYQVNFLSIIFNIFLIPYVSYLLLPFCIISYFIPVFDVVLNFLIMLIELCSLFLEDITFFKLTMCKMNVLIIVLYYVILCLVLKFVNKKKICIFLLIFFFIFHYFYPNVKIDNYIYLFDVGQGDSSLIHVNNKNIMIDTGGVVMYNDNQYTYKLSKNKLIPYLKSKGIRKLSYFILTHGDYDHMGEAINLVENFKVEKVIFNCGEFNELEKDLIKVLDKKEINYYSCIKELNIDKYKLQFLNTKEYDNENDNSNVIYFNYNSYKFLFMGDAETEKEKDILDKYNLKDIDFIKIGHHGSNTSSSEYFIDSVNPKYSLISVGKNNRYGHPKQEVLDTLKNSKIYRTDLDGSIEINLNKNGYKIRTCPP